VIPHADREHEADWNTAPVRDVVDVRVGANDITIGPRYISTLDVYRNLTVRRSRINWEAGGLTLLLHGRTVDACLFDVQLHVLAGVGDHELSVPNLTFAIRPEFRDAFSYRPWPSISFPVIDPGPGPWFDPTPVTPKPTHTPTPMATVTVTPWPASRDTCAYYGLVAPCALLTLDFGCNDIEEETLPALFLKKPDTDGHFRYSPVLTCLPVEESVMDPLWDWQSPHPDPPTDEPQEAEEEEEEEEEEEGHEMPWDNKTVNIVGGVIGGIAGFSLLAYAVVTAVRHYRKRVGRTDVPPNMERLR
jgi:hypothetical protein